jgi:type III pantothenate kinase
MKTSSALLLDIGNSRIKWAVLEGERIQNGAVFAYKEQNRASLFNAHWGALVGLESVMVSNVGGAEIAKDITIWCAKKLGACCYFVQPEKQAYGVTNGYQKPLQLGVDRWVCLVAARAMSDEVSCIIDCGTAVTIDLLTKEGKHLGGMISPGIQLMKQSLLSDTSDISEAGEGQATFLGCCTADAVQNGAVQSVSGLIERALREFKQQYGKNLLPIITGGDAALIRQQLRGDVRLISDLALRGLAVIREDQDK